MDQLTEHEVRLFAPDALAEYVQALISDNGHEQMKRAGITKTRRLRAFLAVAAHETGGFTIIRENTNWTAAQYCALWPQRFKTKLDPRIAACGKDEIKKANLAYADREDIGNKGGNDGWDYRGGGFFQTTGRYNYRKIGRAIGIDLEANPTHIQTCDISLKAALYEWQRMGCNKFADRGYTRAIDNAINRGNPYDDDPPIGEEGRNYWHKRAFHMFPDSDSLLPGLALGAYGSEVEVLQRKLKELNYGVGKVDKVFGPALARAVAAFKFDQGKLGITDLEPEEVVGEKTWTAISQASPVVLTKRSHTTAKELAKESETVQAAMESQAATAIVAGTSVATGVQKASDAGLLDGLTGTFGWAPALHASMVPMIEAVGFFARNFLWVFALIAAVIIWRAKGRIIAARIRDHVRGWNLGR
jgi:putative chitinase